MSKKPEIITCENLKDFFAEFKNCFNSKREGEKWKLNVSYKIVNSVVEEEIESISLILEKTHKALQMNLSAINLSHEEWLSYEEKITKVLKEIWETGEMKNTHGLDLNWPAVNQPNKDKTTEIEEFKKSLVNLKYRKSSEEAKKILNSKIVGFEREKEKFENHVYLYSATKGNFYPKREVIYYAGPPGTGKTTFIKNLAFATGRPHQLIPCAGKKEFADFSILGNSNKPSLVAWAIQKSGSKNPIISLDELEKADPSLQKDFIKLFDLYKKGKKLYDPYFQMEIELNHFTFFATVNYPEDLSPLFKSKGEMRRLEKLSIEEKQKILSQKAQEIEKKYQAKEGTIIPPEIITELPKHIREAGVRQAERVLHKIEKEYLWTRDKGEKFSLGEPKEWLKKNVFAYQESFSPDWKHYFLFFLWGIIWVLLLILIVKKIILKKTNNNKCQVI